MSLTSKQKKKSVRRAPDGVEISPNGYASLAATVYGFEAGLLCKSAAAGQLVSIPSIVKETTMKTNCASALIAKLCRLGILVVAAARHGTAPTLYRFAPKITLLNESVDTAHRKRLILKKYDAEESPLHKLAEWIGGCQALRVCDCNTKLPQSSRRLAPL